MSVKLFESEILGVSLTSLVRDDEEIYFKAKEVAEPLGYSDPKDAVQKHVWEENKFEWRVIKGAKRSPCRKCIHVPSFSPRQACTS